MAESNVNIALVGKARSGKDSLAGYASLLYDYTPFAFGDELKRYAHAIFGVTGGKDRGLYQWFGQTMRERESDVWIRLLFEKVASLRPQRVIVTDCRQPNEHARLKAEGYVIIRVNASDETRLERMKRAGDTFTMADLTHDTESHIDGFAVDYEIWNNGTLTDMTTQFDVSMRELGVEQTLDNVEEEVPNEPRK
jgi:dephospho-CoA kinase